VAPKSIQDHSKATLRTVVRTVRKVLRCRLQLLGIVGLCSWSLSEGRERIGSRELAPQMGLEATTLRVHASQAPRHLWRIDAPNSSRRTDAPLNSRVNFRHDIPITQFSIP
jgi:hypothetical protein